MNKKYINFQKSIKILTTKFLKLLIEGPTPFSLSYKLIA